MLLVEKDKILTFLENAIPKLEDPIEQAYCLKCSCGESIRLPVIATESQVKAFEELLEIAADVLKEKGVIDEVLSDINDQIKNRLNLH